MTLEERAREWAETNLGSRDVYNASDLAAYAVEAARETRDVCAEIAALEAHYWAEVDNERIQEHAMGAMGAASNICAAILMGKTVEQVKAEIAARDGAGEGTRTLVSDLEGQHPSR